MTKEIPLTQGKVALVDDDLFDELSRFKWHAHKSREIWYAAKGSNTFMHRFLKNAPRNMVVDHIDGNGLNNQLFNLRLCTIAENAANRPKNINNTSGYKGVVWEASMRIWKSQITSNGKHIVIGKHATAEDAAKAYDEAAKKYFGEFAHLNFL